MSKTIKKFIDQIKEKEIATKYNAGRIWIVNNEAAINGEAAEAEETFSIGQPVYDEEGNLLGYLGIGILSNLDYATDNDIKIPCEFWKICLPTEHCKHGVKVFTYWQNKEMRNSKFYSFYDLSHVFSD